MKILYFANYRGLTPPQAMLSVWSLQKLGRAVLTKTSNCITCTSAFILRPSVCPKTTLALQKDEAMRRRKTLALAISSFCCLPLAIPCETLGGTYAFFYSIADVNRIVFSVGSAELSPWSCAL